MCPPLSFYGSIAYTNDLIADFQLKYFIITEHASDSLTHMKENKNLLMGVLGIRLLCKWIPYVQLVCYLWDRDWKRKLLFPLFGLPLTDTAAAQLLWSMDLEEITPAWKKRATIMTNYFSIPGTRPFSWPPLPALSTGVYFFKKFVFIFAKPKNQCMMTSKNWKPKEGAAGTKNQ